jgi:hypothetical protein
MEEVRAVRRQRAKRRAIENEAQRLGLELVHHLHKTRGGDWLGDFAQGFKQGFNTVISPAAKVVQAIAPLVGDKTLSGVADVSKALGYGRKRHHRGRGTGAGTGAGLWDDILGVGKTLASVGKVAGPALSAIGLPEVGIPVSIASNLGGRRRRRAGMTLNEALRDGVPTSRMLTATGGKRVLSEKMKHRNQVVKRVMKEKGCSLPTASRYVKEHGLA